MATDYSSLLKKYGVTADQVRGMSDSQLSVYAKKEGLSVSSIRSALGSSAPASSSTASVPSAASAATPKAQQGFGGETQWDTIKQYALANTDVAGRNGYAATGDADLAKLSAGIETQLGASAAALDKMSKANEAMLSGEIPADVSASVRRAASENSIMRGIGGQASRALSARDLGVTSMAVKQTALDTESKITSLRGELATRAQGYRDSLADRNLKLVELENNARELNLKGIDVERQRIATNIAANVSILDSITELVKTQQSLSVQAAGSDIDATGMMSSIDNWLKTLSAKLS